MYFEDYGFLSPVSEYSVIIPLIEGKYFLFEVRSKNLNVQPQEISFPGGKVERNETPIEGAVRELYEELGIKPKKILGKLKDLITPFNLLIHPFLAEIDPSNIKLNVNEVESVFKVPIEKFEKPYLNYNTEIKIVPPDDFPYYLVPNGKNYNWRKGVYEVLFFKYRKKVIWGITAKLAFEAYKKIKGGFINELKRTDREQNK